MSLIDLHWLPVAARIEYKLCTLVYRSVTGNAPTFYYFFHGCVRAGVRGLHGCLRAGVGGLHGWVRMSSAQLCKE